jgi:hypothetical protein
MRDVKTYWGYCTLHGDYRPPTCPRCEVKSARAGVAGVFLGSVKPHERANTNSAWAEASQRQNEKAHAPRADSGATTLKGTKADG